jgi:hypothetical protein
VLITDKEPCKFAVNKRQNTNYSFLPVTSKVSCIRKKRDDLLIQVMLNRGDCMGRFDYFNTAVHDKGRGLNLLYRSTKTHKNIHNYWQYELLTT